MGNKFIRQFSVNWFFRSPILERKGRGMGRNRGKMTESFLWIEKDTQEFLSQIGKRN